MSFLDDIKDIVGDLKPILSDQYSAVVDSKDLYLILTRLKRVGFIHLSHISVVDWIDDGKFELVYTILSYEHSITLLVKTYIDREKGEFETIKELWPIAAIYEREIYEMFGISFRGNDDKRPFILEGWKGIPPMRKEFNLDKYAKRFGRRNYGK